MTTPARPPTDGPIHEYFELSYATHDIVPRTLAQSMPTEWQHRYVAAMNELRAAYAHIETPESYIVEAARESTYECLNDAEMALIGVTHDDGSAVWHDRDGHEHDGPERVLVPTGRDPVPHYNRGRTYVEPRIVDPDLADVWRACLADGYGWVLVIDDVDADLVSDVAIYIVRRTAAPATDGDGQRMPGSYNSEDLLISLEDFDTGGDELEVLRERWAQAQAMAAGLNAAEATR